MLTHFCEVVGRVLLTIIANFIFSLCLFFRVQEFEVTYNNLTLKTKAILQREVFKINIIIHFFYLPMLLFWSELTESRWDGFRLGLT